MFIVRLALLAVLFLTLAQLPGCRYYIDAAPRIIISSEPITPPQSGP